MSPARLRLWGGLTIAASVLGLVIAAPPMVARLSERDNHLVWLHRAITSTEFDYRGHPGRVLTLPAARADGAGAPDRVALEWRGQRAEFGIEPGTRVEPRLPGLLAHEDWLKVLVLAEGARTEHDIQRGVEAGEIVPRLVVAMRRPAEGYDPQSWGLVRRREWRYRLVELLPDGPAESSIRVTDSTYAELDKLGNAAWRRDQGREGDAWMFAAMQQVTPSTLFRTRSRPVDEAMRSMGWTWSVAGVSMTALIAGVLVVSIAGPRRSGTLV